jgi:GntR family transcriptional regulator
VAGKNIELIKEQHLKEIENHMQEILKLSKECGLKLDEMIEMMTLLYEGE